MREETTKEEKYFDLRQADVLDQTRLRPLQIWATYSSRLLLKSVMFLRAPLA
jgi:hypothetical protein